MILSRAWWMALFLVVLFAPVPIGSIEPAWSLALALASVVLGAVALAARRPVSLPRELTPVALLAAWTAFALVPLPRALVAVLSPERLTVPPLPGPEGAVSLSLLPAGTAEQSILLVAVLYLMAGVVRSSPRPAFRLIAVVGVVHAILGLVLQETGGSGPVPGTDTTRIGGLYLANEVLTPFGTYVNKNHFAGLMLIGAGGCLAVLLRRSRRILRGTTGKPLRRCAAVLSRQRFFRLLAPGIGLLVIVLALFASGSRGAAVALVGACIGVVILTGLATRRIRWRPLAAGLVLVLGAFFAAQAGSSVSVAERWMPDGRFMNRPRLWHDSLVMTAHYPVAGIGAGAFESAFPRYQSFDEERRFTHAEGDWVQYLAENGVPGALCLFAFGVVLIRRFLRLMRGGGTNAALAAGGFVGVLGIIGHGCLDSGLHMPANLVAASVLTAGLLAIPWTVKA